MFVLSPLHPNPIHTHTHTRRDEPKLFVLFFFVSFFFPIVHTLSNGYLIFLNCRPQSSLHRVFNLYLGCFVFAALLAIIDHRSGILVTERPRLPPPMLCDSNSVQNKSQLITIFQRGYCIRVRSELRV